MSTYNITMHARLSHAPGDDVAILIGRRWAATVAAQLLGTTVRSGEPRIGVAAAFDTHAPTTHLPRLVSALVEVLASFGLTVTRWDSVELVDGVEAQRRLTAAAVPPLVSAAQLAEMCGVSAQRIYELEGERRRADGPHPFPAPVVHGYWLESMARTYAATRKRKPGPAKRVEASEQAAADVSRETAPAGERGCSVCSVVGPLLTAPGTSGRAWTCGDCGEVWQ